MKSLLLINLVIEYEFILFMYMLKYICIYLLKA